MTDPLRDPGFLTTHQLRFPDAPSNIYLTACPGSGKTRAAAVRVARLIRTGRRVAMCSYTNVGADQIAETLSGSLSIVVPPDSFVGTLHRFLLTYVFYPFGHLVSRHAGRHVLLPDDSPRWPTVALGKNSIRGPISHFKFRPDGTVMHRGKLPRGIPNSAEATRLGAATARPQKLAAASRGLISLDDTMYWSFAVLRDYPAIARGVAARFDEILVDEAQDTSELQLAALEVLHSVGRCSLVLVGDLNQSIYGFNGASPAGCDALARAARLEPMEFTENHRSSQLICDAAGKFRATGEADRAVGSDSACPWNPELLVYDATRPSAAVELFHARLSALGIPPEDAAVLARTNEFVDELNGRQRIDLPRRLRALCRVAVVAARRDTLTRGDLESLERLLAFLAWDREHADVPSSDRETLRDVAVRLAHTLPDPAGTLQEWVRAVAASVASATRALNTTPVHEAARTLRALAEYGAVAAADVVLAPQPALSAQTVHDVKGESRDAVLVVADAGVPTRHTAQPVAWGRPLRGEAVPADEAEEVRIVFVALTRARRYCAVALPDTTPPAIVQAFEAAGFIRG